MRTTTIHCDGCGSNIPGDASVFTLALAEEYESGLEDLKVELDLCLECSQVIHALAERGRTKLGS